MVGLSSGFADLKDEIIEKVKGLAPTVLQNIAADNHIEPFTEPPGAETAPRR